MSTETATATTFLVEELKVGELQVDHRVQRESMKYAKVEKIKRDFNQNALGVITVSRRADRGLYIIDGMHRVQAVKELTDGTGEVVAHVFEGLTVPQEALMFLDLNYGDKPTALDRFRVRVQAEDPVAVGISEALNHYQWKVSPSPANGSVQAVEALERLWRRSEAAGADPNLLNLYTLIVTRAWGSDRTGMSSSMIEGLGRVLVEYGDRIDVQRMIEHLREYRGGAVSLLSEASQLAKLSRTRVSMAVASSIVEAYNKGLRKAGKVLPEWRHRS